MKINSLVVIVKPLPKTTIPPFIKWLPVDDGIHVYTIRDIRVDPDTNEECVYFEEGCIGFCSEIEVGLEISYVREIQPPEEVDVQQLVEESLLLTI